MLNITNVKKGFTLIEILVVIGLIAILASIVLIAINPARQFALGRDAQRISNVNAILNAVSQRLADNKGVFGGAFSIAGVTYTCPALGVSLASSTIVTSGGNAAVYSFDLSCLTPTYIPALPTDPATANGPSTGYSIRTDATGRVYLVSSTTELSIPRTDYLSVSR